MTLHCIPAVLVVLSLAVCSGGEPKAAFPWLDPTGADGTAVFVGGELAEAARNQVAAWASSNDARIVAVETDGRVMNGFLVNPSELPEAIIAGGILDHAKRDDCIAAVSKHPARLGFCIGHGAALAVKGRQLQALGDGSVTVLLAAGAGRALRELELASGDRHDLTMLRRAALERSRGAFPPQVLPPPIVERGSLFIHGGGQMPTDATQKFLELAGGPDAPIVVLPIAAEGALAEDISADTRLLTRAGATNVKSLRARTKEEVESPEFAAALNAATGVWFNGGRQWRFVDAYMGTIAEKLLRGVLERGGVIGGSSAGASIQSQYMPRGSPLGNFDMMAEGYERGLAFLPGTAVDQHFTQRKRHADMTSLMRRYPQLLGIGLDEGTAIVVQGSIAEVIGRGKVHFYDYRCGPPAAERDYSPLSAGGRYELAERRVLPPSH